MNKCDDKFCPDCGHHLYVNKGVFICVECGVTVSADDVKTFDDVKELRERYDAQAEAE